MSIKLFLVFFLVFLALDLMVVESTHFHAISVHICFDFLILNMILDDVLQGQHVPGVVLFWFDMANCSLLHTSLTMVELWNTTDALIE